MSVSMSSRFRCRCCDLANPLVERAWHLLTQRRESMKLIEVALEL